MHVLAAIVGVSLSRSVPSGEDVGPCRSQGCVPGKFCAEEECYSKSSITTVTCTNVRCEEGYECHFKDGMPLCLEAVDPWYFFDEVFVVARCQEVTCGSENTCVFNDDAYMPVCIPRERAEPVVPWLHEVQPCLNKTCGDDTFCGEHDNANRTAECYAKSSMTTLTCEHVTCDEGEKCVVDGQPYCIKELPSQHDPVEELETCSSRCPTGLTCYYESISERVRQGRGRKPSSFHPRRTFCHDDNKPKPWHCEYGEPYYLDSKSNSTVCVERKEDVRCDQVACGTDSVCVLNGKTRFAVCVHQEPVAPSKVPEPVPVPEPVQEGCDQVVDSKFKNAHGTTCSLLAEVGRSLRLNGVCDRLDIMDGFVDGVSYKARDACCYCKETKPKAPEPKPACEDKRPNGEAWIAGPHEQIAYATCEYFVTTQQWYEETRHASDMCTDYGHLKSEDGMTANEACCLCSEK